MMAERAREVFFESLEGLLVLRGVARPRADVGKTELLQKRSDIALVKIDAEPLGDDPFQIHLSPSRDTVDFQIGTRLDDLGEFRQWLRPLIPGEAAPQNEMMPRTGTESCRPGV